MRLLRFWSIRFLLCLGLVVGGVAVGQPEPPAIAVRLPFRSYNLRFSGDDVYSLDVQLHRSPTKWRGRAFGRVANLTLKEDGVSGVIGAAPVNLKVREEGDILLAEGGFLGGPVRLRFSPKELHLYMGGCTYELAYTEGRYQGPRSCDSNLAPAVQVSVPDAFGGLGPTEQATLLLFSLADLDGNK